MAPLGSSSADDRRGRSKASRKFKPAELPALNVPAIEVSAEPSPASELVIIEPPQPSPITYGRAHFRSAMGLAGPPSVTPTRATFGSNSGSSQHAGESLGYLGILSIRGSSRAAGELSAPSTPITPQGHGSRLSGRRGAGLTTNKRSKEKLRPKRSPSASPLPKTAPLLPSDTWATVTNSSPSVPVPIPVPGPSELGIDLKPLERSDHAWKPSILKGWRPFLPEDTPLLVERSIRSLLNKLTSKNLDITSSRLVAWANRSEFERNAQTLASVVQGIVDAVDSEFQESRLELYARLVRSMLDQISQGVKADSIKDKQGRHIVGGALFGKLLMDQCQELFEKDWPRDKAQGVLSKSTEEAAEKPKGVTDDPTYSPISPNKRRHRRLGVVLFIGELFNMQVCPESTLYECLRRLVDGGAKGVAYFSRLLMVVGKALEAPKSKKNLDIYFRMIKMWSEISQIRPRLRFVLLDVLELRERGWVPRGKETEEGETVVLDTSRLELNLEDVDQADQDFASFDEEEKVEVLRRLVERALRANHRTAKFIVWFLSRLSHSPNCSAEVFERSFIGSLKSLVDTSLDAPRAYDYMGRMLLASDLPPERVEQLSQYIITDGDPEEAENKLLRAYRARLAY
ncbi:hypothetical protein FRC00_006419 [Tulasnella sp. 408]|nr:hypothetical protein FRC00_006419 [Tulasnella sp. 408]